MAPKNVVPVKSKPPTRSMFSDGLPLAIPEMKPRQHAPQIVLRALSYGKQFTRSLTKIPNFLLFLN
jgi:hypothetical protein